MSPSFAEKMARAEVEADFFGQQPPPDSLAEHETLVRNFIDYHRETSRRVALVTSGGTTVPIEAQTVRFLDNFSGGTRGARSAEYFLQRGYAVIFLHRQNSLLPYDRHYSNSKNCLLDLLDVVQGASGDSGSDGHRITVRREHEDQLCHVLQQYRSARENNLLLLLPFETVTDYLFHLRSVTILMWPLRATGLVYLAAAVSDFFIPHSEMAEHKIQSSVPSSHPRKDGVDLSCVKSENLSLDLKPVPKFLKSLVDDWAPVGSMIISFKLETDSNILLDKAHGSLQRYGQHLVIGNLLSTRQSEVVFVEPDQPRERWIRVPSDEDGLKMEIESLIVDEVAKMHSEMIGEER
ncbi:putative phosphopantothenate-cysteine ligase [Aspergillus steynii IBT 23096]|uniref:Putative phosphopantothenate-cysteine ligase n=1 Tax=Aspergillus steynii IBT 23096 TaxID=1392250 RepID=A0A2I2GCP9_9EURO|nr:putative phosphopantothenate-cysteine ligase [Aspergillus steynii IBT 23096]PLB50666.1 putative phosphopantothenate-cysteine ligase [Aspergillus steynii IBT 23096]